MARKQMSMFDFCEIQYSSKKKRRAASADSGKTDTTSEASKC